MRGGGTDRFRGAGAIVTGASRGIGAAIARALAAEGFRLLLVSRDRAALDRRVAELARQGAEAHALPLDLTSPGAIEAVRSAALEQFGAPYLLVNNAEIGFAARLAHKPPPELAAEITLDLLVPVLLDRAVLPELLRRGRGQLLHLGSGIADVGVPRLASYAAAKAGLRQFSRTLDLEIRRSGVRSTVVEPIYVRTDFGRRPGEAEGPIAALARRHPRLVLEPELVARYVVEAVRRPRPVVKVPLLWAWSSPVARLGARLGRRWLELPPRPGPPQ